MPKKEFEYLPGEEVIFEIRPAFIILLAYLLPLILAVAGLLTIFSLSLGLNIWLFIVVILAGIFVALVVFLNWYFTIFRLTNKRVENRYGIFGSREEEVALMDVQSIDYQNTILGKIFNFGTVIIKAAGQHREVDFTNITSAKRVADEIEDLAMKVRSNGNRPLSSEEETPNNP
ncbi:MAG: PH domain-containing protein [Candidatus Berkelbacteria bacterium]|nr:PH domain-containing protein [Candidatus Berkelbacteria bacterium]